jgi:hypothetical protein
MIFNKIVRGILVIAVFLSFSLPSFCETKKEYMEQLSQAREDFIAERDKLHDQDRLLRIAWHSERDTLYQQLKVSPEDKSLQEKLNEGAKKFFADKKAVHSQLKQLRHNWNRIKKDLGQKIKNS